MTQETDNAKRGPDTHRFRWLVLGCVLKLPVVIIFLLSVSFYFGIPDKILQSKLEAQREAAHARGEVTCLDDFQLKALPDNENAAVAYNNAYKQFQFPAGTDFDEQKIWDRYIASKTYEIPPPKTKKGEIDMPNGPLTSDEEKQVDNFIASNENAYKAVCDAGKIPGCQFADYDDPSAVLKVFSDKTFFSKMDSVRPLARIIALRAVWEARHGNTEAAYVWIIQGFHLAEALRNDPTLMTGVKRNGVIATVLDSLNTLMCETPWSGRLPDRFEQELEQLKDRRVLARYFEGERFFVDADLASQWPELPSSICSMQRNTLYKVNSDFITAIQESDPVKRKELFLKIELYISGDRHTSSDSPENIEKEKKESLIDKVYFVFQLHKMMAMIETPAPLLTMETFDNSEAQVQNTRQALALKRYKQAHGQYPDQLQQIISAEMNALPRDPFSGELFHYKKEGEGFLLYSVGPNYVDDGGIFPKTKRRKDGDVIWRVTQ